jgi:Malate/L-lactate dehydrogenase
VRAEIVLARRLGKELPEGVAFGPDGRPTRDPVATLDGGAIRAWGGAKGSGLAIVVQLLRAMCASPPLPQGMYEYGCLFVVMSPGLLMPVEAFYGICWSSPLRAKIEVRFVCAVTAIGLRTDAPQRACSAPCAWDRGVQGSPAWSVDRCPCRPGSSRRSAGACGARRGRASPPASEPDDVVHGG